MQRAPRLSRAQAQAIAIPRPETSIVNEWIAVGVALALVLAGLLLP